MGTARKDTPPEGSSIETADTAPIEPPTDSNRADVTWPDTSAPFDSSLDAFRSFDSSDDPGSIADTDSIDRVLLAGLDWRRPDPKVERASSEGAPAAVHHAFHDVRDRVETPEFMPKVLVERAPEPPLGSVRPRPPQPIRGRSASIATWQLLAIAVVVAVPVGFGLFYGWRVAENASAPAGETTGLRAPAAIPATEPAHEARANEPRAAAALEAPRGHSAVPASPLATTAPTAIDPSHAGPPHRHAARKPTVAAVAGPSAQAATPPDDLEPPRTY